MHEADNKNTSSIVALRKWVRDIGISDVTAWRWSRDGLIHPINIHGKLYLTQSDIEQFAARAQRGEFAKAPVGCAAPTGGQCSKPQAGATRAG
jgi:hypothetical protein